MKVLVCGATDYHNDQHVEDELTDIHQAQPITTLVLESGTSWISLCAFLWAWARGISICEHSRKWSANRSWEALNRRMITDTRPDLVLAFPGDEQTEDMLALAEAEGIEILQADTRP